MFNVIHHVTQFKADFYLTADDPLQHWALQHRRRIDLERDGIWVAPPEYVIVRKLEFLREGHSDKHVRDIRFILAATSVDESFLDREVLQRSLQAEWERCKLV
jgi:elongation factor P hydroxylase